MAQPRPALVFDLDGTLIDSAPDLRAALNRLLQELGRPPLSLGAVKAMIGDGTAKLVERGLARTGPLPPAAVLADLVRRFLALYEADLAGLTRPYPEVPETLQALAAAGYRLAICTNKPNRPTRDILDRLDLARYFAAVVGGDSTPARKPDPGHLRAALAQLDGGAERAVMIGDSINDVAVARNAGIPVIALSYGYSRVPARDLGADLVLDRFGALPQALDRPPFR